MSQCPSLKGCPFFNDKMDNMPALANMYKDRYCTGKFTTCARYKVATEAGKDKVPSNLFPNQIDRVEALLK